MFKIIQRFLNTYNVKKDTKFQKVIIDYWYCGEWYMYRSELHAQKKEYRSNYVEWPIENKILFNPFKCGLVNNDVSRLVDGLIPVVIIDGEVGLYKVTHKEFPGFYHDAASWDDGVHVTLTLRRIITSEQYNNIRVMSNT